MGVHVSVGWPSLPIAAGLGSSAAYSVAAAGSLLLARSRFVRSFAGTPSSASLEQVPARADDWREASTTETSIINDWAFCAEALFHG